MQPLGPYLGGCGNVTTRPLPRGWGNGAIPREQGSGARSRVIQPLGPYPGGGVMQPLGLYLGGEVMEPSRGSRGQGRGVG